MPRALRSVLRNGREDSVRAAPLRRPRLRRRARDRRLRARSMDPAAVLRAVRARVALRRASKWTRALQLESSAAPRALLVRAHGLRAQDVWDAELSAQDCRPRDL